MNTNIRFCQMLLADARVQAAQAGVEVPKGLSTYTISIGNSLWCEVYAKDLPGHQWAGYADNAYEAKCKYIHRLIEQAEEAAAEAAVEGIIDKVFDPLIEAARNH